MTVTLARFQELDEKCISMIEAAESGQREMTLTKRSISEDIAASEEYVTAADEFMFETGRYIESYSAYHKRNICYCEKPQDFFSANDSPRLSSLVYAAR